ncbi:hypothetical protein FB384_004221 [Prauserella sediminis]|uniref:Secreted protein n=1 Tax=Prauserella sediminis TaxID=577680 RepID=A0A839XW32_9PSEU|nr:hypothetical protein [Prauserella sediminis]MBB3665268.1 hypothetical protein [Prauserella sediminis]
MKTARLLSIAAAAAMTAGTFLAASPAIASDANPRSGTTLASETKDFDAYVRKSSRTSSNPPNSNNCVSIVGKGAACFEPHGDWFWLKDNYADGYSIHAKANTSVMQASWRCSPTYGSEADWQKCTFHDVMPEGTPLAFEMQVRNGDEVLAFSEYLYISS